MRALLISTYDLGRQPLGLAAPAAWLRQAGVDVDCVDTSREPLDDAHIRAASLVAFYLPMHTATRLAAPLLQRVRARQSGRAAGRLRAVRAAQSRLARGARRARVGTGCGTGVGERLINAQRPDAQQPIKRSI